LIIDDVVSAGTSVRESVSIIKDNNAQVAGISVALDRQEKGQGNLSAIGELKQEYKLTTVAIAGLNDLISYLANDKQKLRAIQHYKNKYGSY